MNPHVKRFLSEIGRKGGLKSRRVLTREQSLAMIAAREAKRNKKPGPGECDQSPGQ